MGGVGAQAEFRLQPHSAKHYFKGAGSHLILGRQVSSWAAGLSGGGGRRAEVPHQPSEIFTYLGHRGKNNKAPEMTCSFSRWASLKFYQRAWQSPEQFSGELRSLPSLPSGWALRKSSARGLPSLHSPPCGPTLPSTSQVTSGLLGDPKAVGRS